MEDIVGFSGYFPYAFHITKRAGTHICLVGILVREHSEYGLVNDL